MVVKSVGLLTSSKSFESPHRQRVGTCVFAAEQLAVLCYWLVGYAFTFLIGCRFWVCIFFFFLHPCRCWSGILAAGCQFAAQCPSVCRGERCDVVGYSSGGVLRHLSGLLQVMCAHRFAFHIPAHRICRVAIAVAAPLCCADPRVFPINTGNVSQSVPFTSFPVHGKIYLSRHKSSATGNVAHK